MNQAKPRLLNPRRVVIFLSVLLGLMHVILLGWTIQRRSAAAQLDNDKLALQENLGQLQQINQDQLDALQAELDALQLEVAELENSLPLLGPPFAIYRRGLALAQQSQVELLEISLIASEPLDTVSGLIIRQEYNIETEGSLENCLEFINNLEQAGQDTVILELASIDPGDNRCSLDINTIGIPSGMD